jgi:glycosyltransferase involved in cell wall biosynthesis
MIEAMACGTPVVAWNCGSVPEVLEDGVSGRIVDSEDAAVAAVSEVLKLDRGGVRAAFERRFTAATMARNYLDLYERLVASDMETPEFRALPAQTAAQGLRLQA